MKKMNNNGFSLVELIVVIAIMAILVGVLAPSVLGQLDKAKISKDKQSIETVVTAYATAYADQMVTVDKPDAGALSNIEFTEDPSVVYSSDGGETDFDGAVKAIVGYSKVQLESSEYKGKDVTIELSASGKVTATVVGESGATYTVTR